jgi:small subunit ribosomal protein S15Ae
VGNTAKDRSLFFFCCFGVRSLGEALEAVSRAVRLGGKCHRLPAWVLAACEAWRGIFFGVALTGASLCRMVRVSVLNDCLRAIVNAERLGKRQVIVRPSSKVIIKFLQTMMAKGYIGEFEIVDDHRGNKIVVELLGRINKCGVVTPRFDVALTDLERWIGTLLPSRQFGYLVLTTSEVRVQAVPGSSFLILLSLGHHGSRGGA